MIFGVGVEIYALLPRANLPGDNGIGPEALTVQPEHTLRVSPVDDFL